VSRNLPFVEASDEAGLREVTDECGCSGKRKREALDALAAEAPPAEEVYLTEKEAEDMRGAVDYARAAYGYAFLSGGLSSIARYLHMQVRQLASLPELNCN
jgi:hypothetical protein